jgi:GNAT superfamily N-acetyltransferase
MRANEFIVEYNEDDSDEEEFQPSTTTEKYRGVDVTTKRPWEDRIEIVLQLNGQKIGRMDLERLHKYSDDYEVKYVTVEPEYRKKGLGELMYDYASRLGCTIHQSDFQTDDGRDFWERHRPGERVWEDEN